MKDYNLSSWREAEGMGYKGNGGVGLKEGKVVWENVE